MTLPRRPGTSEPIPQSPFSSPDVTLLQGPYWDVAVGEGLETDEQGSIQIDSSGSSVPSAYLYGSNGFVGVGNGLIVDSDGYLKVD